jgi:peptidoglycan/xylan/chitin deacetylase (PgdA/CDA1 family)
MVTVKRVTKLVISAAFWLVVFIARHFRRSHPGTCVILYYHVLKDDHRKRFARQMDTLLRLANPISLNTRVELKSGKHHVAVTFDDGFEESLRNAIPELQKRKIPVMVFVPTGCLGLQAPWLNERQQRTEGRVVLCPDEIKELNERRLVSFGSHCVSHRPLPGLNDRESKEEISQSKIELENILGERVETLSFPYGAFERRHADWARQAGYTRVFSISPEFAFAQPNKLVTGRIRVDPADWAVEFRLKLLGAYRWLPMLLDRAGSDDCHV